jgi:hypothetical protein
VQIVLPEIAASMSDRSAMTSITPSIFTGRQAGLADIHYRPVGLAR